IASLTMARYSSLVAIALLVLCSVVLNVSALGYPAVKRSPRE
ncbi:hypothetical protein V3C99_003785, partial [Haemonchus contortus]|uniref:ABC transporter permease n=1 Tax=Haemonchus contortus TaxID=6289 RepID=A0A7I4XZB6_HAECO